MAGNRKTRKKRHSVMKRDHKLYGRSRIWTWESQRHPDNDQQYTYAETKTSFGWCRLGHDLAQHLIDYPRNWLICVRMLWIDNAGGIYMEQSYFDLPARRINDVEGVYLTLREELLRNRKTGQIFDVGWIAQTWTGNNPVDTDETWFYQDTPPGIAPHQRMAGPDYSRERWEKWQQHNREFFRYNYGGDITRNMTLPN